MSDLTTTEPGAQMLERVVIGGDLSKLSSAERMQYYQALCQSVNLNPLTRPFQYLTLSGRLTLYATKDATDQLRRVHGVSITKLERETTEGVYCVTAYATDAKGRTDTAIGAVSLEGLRGVDRANAIMRAETKGKRRVTLSLCGLGMLDESELETVPGAARATVDHATGEILTAVVERRPTTGTTTLTPDSLLGGAAVTGVDTDGPSPAPAGEDMDRSLILSIIQTLRDKVTPAQWTMALHKRGLGIDTLGRTDVVVLQELAGDLKAASERTRRG